MKFVVGCLISFIVSFLLSKHFATLKIVQDTPGSGPQKVHPKRASRMGGVAILLALTLAALATGLKDLILLILSSLPVFVIALYEDIFQKVRPSLRLIISFCSAFIFSVVFNIYITHIDIPFLDAVLDNPLLGLMFTIFAIAGITNSFNIIDGLHGLASGIGIIILAFYSLTAYLVGDMLIFGISILTVFALLGFFLINYPSGKILLGDNGAYFLGFIIATTSILLVFRNSGISPWFPLLSVAYPFTETVFSIYRRRFAKRKAAMNADFLHMHSLVFKRYTRNNPKTSTFFWAGTFLFCLISFLIRSNTKALIGLYLVYIAIYVASYIRIVRFRNRRVIFFDNR